MDLLTVNNLKVTYRNSNDTVVLDNISFSIQDGEFVSVIGPSGCGKTTLLHCIAGLRVYEGTISLHGEKPGNRIGYVFQTPRLLNWLTMRENVAAPLRVCGTPLVDLESMVSQRLRDFEVEHIADKYPLFCSEGEKARAALARAFVLSSELVLMDEPFANLDRMTADKIRTRLIAILKENASAVLFVTHNLSEAVSLSDRVLVLSDKPTRVKTKVLIDLEKPRDELLSEEVLAIERQLKNHLGGT
jgi:ABC-type nitrate/sulfonate/bicarbonate transport system ATPase subunit